MTDTPRDTPKAKRLDNLAPPWPKGVSGNPKGKPLGAVSLRAMLRAGLDSCAPGERRTRAELLVERLLDQAIAGDVRAFTLIIEQVEGKAPATIDLRAQVEAVDPGDPREKIVAAVRAMLPLVAQRQTPHLLAIIEGREREYDAENTEYVYRCTMEAIDGYDARNMGWAYACYRNALDIVADFESRHPDAAEKYLDYLNDGASDR